MKKPTVLQVVPFLDMSGAPQGSVDIAIALRSQGLGSYIATESVSNEILKKLEGRGVDIIKLPVKSKNPFTIFYNIFRLRRIALENKINIIHARSRAPAWSAFFAARMTDITFVTTFHGTYNFNNFIKRFYNSIMTHGDTVIAISNFIKGHIAENYLNTMGKVKLIHRGIDTEKFDPATTGPERITELKNLWKEKLGVVIPNEAFVLALPGRVTFWKGHKVVIDALKKLTTGNKNFFCLFIGNYKNAEKETALYTELKEIVKKNNLEKYLGFVGHCNDMPAAYCLADVIISASTDPEAFGRVSVEAQLMCKPVIATDHGASRETIEQGGLSMLIPPNDSEALQKAVELVKDKLPNSQQLFENRKKILQNYSLNIMCSKTIESYFEVINE